MFDCGNDDTTIWFIEHNDCDESIINLNSIKNPTAGGDNFSGLD